MTEDNPNVTKPGDAINGFAELYPREITHNVWAVLSLRNDGVTAHRVDVTDLSCTCEDMDYNQEGNGICDHLAVALYESPKRKTIAEDVTADLATMMNRLDKASEDARETADALEGSLIAQRDADAGTAADADTTSSQPKQDDSPPGRDIDAGDAADRLQSAYDDVVEDMQVQAHEGWVWVQTGRDTPDELPGPGNVDPFTAFLQGPDDIEYIHDEHEAVGQKPGEWWKNRIAPEAVDGYIEEVLE
jgi:hypothetical protein